MPRAAADTREHVLSVARELFYWHGIRATGVDRIASEAGISPTTLYRLFASKDDLVAAYVEREQRGYEAWFEAATDVPSGDPRDRILALFDALAEAIDPRRCRGCPFQMALAETPQADLPTHELAVAAKAWVRDRLRELVDELAADTEVEDSSALADQLALVMEGVYASAQALGPDGPARHAQRLVRRLLQGDDAPG
jgi:AcrR family transcriptional regulator